MFNLGSTEVFIGKCFFYYDKETGIGWESKIDHIWLSNDRADYLIELSCGTLVKVCYLEILKNKYKAFLTNLPEDIYE